MIDKKEGTEMADDFWKDIGDRYDPFGTFDRDGDGHDRGEAWEAIDFEDAVSRRREQEEDDLAEFYGDEDEEEDEEY